MWQSEFEMDTKGIITQEVKIICITLCKRVPQCMLHYVEEGCNVCVILLSKMYNLLKINEKILGMFPKEKSFNQ